MDRVMSVEERIRRAEDIYNRRNGIYTRTTNEVKTKNIGNKRKTKRLFMQIFICLSIYVIFYTVTNRNYIFSEDFRNSVNVLFKEKMNFSEIYFKAKNYVLTFFEDEEQNTTVENLVDNQVLESQEKKNDTKEEKDENIGGASENTENIQNNDKKKTENISQKKDEKLTEQQLMEKEAKEIKKSISFVAPIKGRISSTFGWRNPTTSKVPKYHSGVDIAAIEGTKIKSSTDGKIILASSSGDYGNHYQIQIKDVIIVYAHCKKLYLKEGDSVKKGQEIAEVGSTGNSTGPHLHFEVRRNGRKIDPQLILDL